MALQRRFIVDKSTSLQIRKQLSDAFGAFTDQKEDAVVKVMDDNDDVVFVVFSTSHTFASNGLSSLISVAEISATQ